MSTTRSHSRSQLRRHLVRLLLTVVLAFGGVMAVAQPAAADICQDAPAPVGPKTGLPGMLTSVPKSVPATAPDPFKNPAVPIGDVYGYNWSWANFDLGCGSDFLRDPVAVANTKSANVIMAGLGGVLASLASLEQMAKTSSLDWLSTVVTGVADRLKGPLLGIWLPLALLGVGLMIGYRSKRASYADTLRTALVILVAAGMATFALVFPGTASKAVDQTVVSVAGATGAQFSASASDAVTRESAYRTWLAGNFGDPDSALARELGPRLMSATHYTWSDTARMQTDPNAKKGIDQAKATEFKAVAKEIQQRDPAAYEVFTGRGERTAPALLGVLVVLCMGLFIGLAMLMVLISRVMMQGLALAAPLAAVLGVLPSHNSVLTRLWDLFTASIVAVAKFVIAGGVMALVLGAIQGNDAMGAGAKLFWVIVATVVGIVLTKPVRSFKTIMPGMSPDRSYLRAALSGVATYVGARNGSEDGVRAGLVPGGELSTGSPDHSMDHSWRDARESLEPLPALQWDDARPQDPSWTQVPTAGSARRTVNPGEWSRGQLWPGVVAGASARQELTATPGGQLALPAGSSSEPRTSAGSPLAVAMPTGADLGGSTSSDTVVDSPVVGGRGLTVVGSAQTSAPPPDRTGAPHPVTGPGETEAVIYPSGVIVAMEEHTLYQRASQSSSEVYVAMPDRELAADGSEHEMVTYHSGAGSRGTS